MYHNYDDAENCIRAFYFLGYEAKFAKVNPFSSNAFISDVDSVIRNLTTSV